MDGIICAGYEVEWLASLTTHPSLRQRLQNARWLIQGVPNQTHTQIEWVNTAIGTVWTNAGELPGTVSKWHTYAKLTQVVRKLCMRQVMFKLNAQSPDNGRFTGCMQDSILNSAPSAYFGSSPAMLTPHVGHPIDTVTLMIASLEDSEGQQQAKGLSTLRAPKGSRADKGPTQMTQAQIWANLITAGLDKNKIDKQPNAVLLEQWKQLSPE